MPVARNVWLQMVFRQADGLGPPLDHPQGVVAVHRARSVSWPVRRSMERKSGAFLSSAMPAAAR